MADDQTPPAGGSSRRVPVPLPILVGIVVAIAAGIYLFRKNATSSAGAQQANTANAQPPVVVTGAGGGGIPSGLLYALLQNQQSSPTPVRQRPPAPGGGGTKPPAPVPSGTPTVTANQQYSLAPGASQTGQVPNINGMTLNQAIAALQNAGYGISSASYNYQNLTQGQLGQFGGTHVVSYTPNGNSVAIGLW